MRWIKKGWVFAPDERTPDIATHAQVPTVLVKEDVLRVYYAGRNKEGKALPYFVDLDRNNPSRVVRVGEKPVLGFGKPGTFDDEGVMPSDVITMGSEILFYYSGWNQRVTIPYHNSMGLAVSRDGGETFTRLSDGPIMDRTFEEPYIAVTPCVLREENEWKMWYVSGIKWIDVHGHYEPVYHIKYAYSTNGIHWVRPNITCIHPRYELEAFSRPYVIQHEGKYHMWFCCRGSHDYRDGSQGYRMGYADSVDGIHWERQDAKAGITVSEDGWDSKMVCYPFIANVGEKRYLFHNGNGFGRSGFGYAEWSAQ